MIKGVIYKYTSPSGKCYIGQTTNEESRRTDWRLSSHYAGIKINNARIKYGYQNFKYEVLYTCFNENFKLIKKELNIKEVEYIKLYDSFNNGYNMTPGGDSSIIGLTHDWSKKKVYQWDLDGNLIAEHESIKVAHEKTGVAMSTINLLCTNKSYGRHLKYLFTSVKEFNFDVKKNYHKPVVVYDLDLNYIKQYDSIKDAAKDLKLPAYHIREICEKTMLKRLKGYTFSYVGEAPPNQTVPGGKEVFKYIDDKLVKVFKSISQAANDCGMTDNVFRKRIKQSDVTLNNIKYRLNNE